MELTAENYYGKEANKAYMSVSQFKDFNGTYGKMACEFEAMEKLEERWNPEPSTALLVGSYVDSYIEGTLDDFKKRMLAQDIRPTKKPDFDNIGKIICDSLNLVAYHDDSAVVDAQVRKFYSEQPRVEVVIKQIQKG